jgi:hypothetical protein
MLMRGLNCCGASEMIGINDSQWTPKVQMKYYAKEYMLTDANIAKTRAGKAFCPMTYAYDVGRDGGGCRTNKQGKRRLAAWKKFVEDNGLGLVVISPKAAYNPNYGNQVRIIAAMFIPDNLAIYDHFNPPAVKPPRTRWSIT